VVVMMADDFPFFFSSLLPKLLTLDWVQQIWGAFPTKKFILIRLGEGVVDRTSLSFLRRGLLGAFS